jgi:hypothetical protein
MSRVSISSTYHSLLQVLEVVDLLLLLLGFLLLLLAAPAAFHF